MRRVVVVGGGVAGLAAAYRIRETAKSRGMEVDVRLLEAGPTVGGKIDSIQEDGFLCESGPNGFLDNEPATLRLVHDLGLDDQLQRSNDASRRRFLVRDGNLVEMHMHPIKFLKSPLLSRGAKWRMAWEYFVRAKKNDTDETVGDFGRRRLGKEFTNIMLDSMVSGIYAGDVDRLSVAAAFPKVVELEREHGGLFRGMLAKKKEKSAEKKRAKQQGAVAKQEDTPAVQTGPTGVLHSFKDGMAAPLRAMAQALGSRSIRCGAAVARIENYGNRGGYRIHLADGETVDTDVVVLTTPAPATAQILHGLDDGTAELLSEIPIAGVHVCCLGFRNDQIAADIDVFGALIPRQEGIRTLGTIFSSSTFEGRAPKGFSLLTCMIGGRHDDAASELSDDAMLEQVLTDIRPLLGIEGAPVFSKVFRWARGIPQYELGHNDRVAAAHESIAAHPGLWLGGNSVAGVSFNHCIAHAEELGNEVCDFLQGSGAGSAEEA